MTEVRSVEERDKLFEENKNRVGDPKEFIQYLQGLESHGRLPFYEVLGYDSDEDEDWSIVAQKTAVFFKERAKTGRWMNPKEIVIGQQSQKPIPVQKPVPGCLHSRVHPYQRHVRNAPSAHFVRGFQTWFLTLQNLLAGTEGHYDHFNSYKSHRIDLNQVSDSQASVI